jgi:predicted phosphodiesterase
MASALSAVRDRRVAPRESRFLALGLRKYGLCLLAGGSAAAVSSAAGTAWAVATGLFAFYAVEARHVFDFPAAMDYGRRARAASRVLHRRAGGTIMILTCVVPIVAFMLLGWLASGRPRWNFAVGCMAVILWYESLRRREDAMPCLVEIGSSAPLSVRRVGDGDPGPDPVKVLYASDLHLGAWGASRAMRELLRATVRERPDVVLLGGDLVDARRALPQLRAWTHRLRRWAAVAAVPGNHDARWLPQVASMVTEAGGHWLPDRPLWLRGLRIDGAPVHATRGGERRLLCAHHPDVFESAVALGYDLVLAGHLHGGQLILCDVRGRHYPGALISRWTGPEFAAAQATMWVSRGLADTLPVRFRCPREVLVATLRRAHSYPPGMDQASTPT